MARPKGAKNKKKHVFEDPQIEGVVEEWVEFNCPIRGKVRQKVKVKRLKRVTFQQRTFVGAQDLIDDLESKEDGISSLEPDPED